MMIALRILKAIAFVIIVALCIYKPKKEAK